MWTKSTLSSQGVLKMSYFSVDTRSMSSLPLINSLVKNRLFETAPEINETPFQFIHTMDLSVVDKMLHDRPDLVIHRTEIWAVCTPQVGRKKVWRFLTRQFNCCTVVQLCWCTVQLEESRYETLCVSLAAVWRYYVVVQQQRTSQ